jgi:cytochrome c-type biogenesis protein CcmH/NrfG
VSGFAEEQITFWPETAQSLLREMRRAARQCPASAEICARLGDALYVEGHYEDAASAFRLA